MESSGMTHCSLGGYRRFMGTFSPRSSRTLCMKVQATTGFGAYATEIAGIFILFTKKVKLSLCVINLASCHEDVLGSGGMFLT